jgi:predicted nucleic acid-binding Zn ribbon protein
MTKKREDETCVEVCENIKDSEKKIERNFKKWFSNYWAVAAVVLAVLLIIVLVFPRSGSGGIGAKEAGEKVIKFVTDNGGQATVISTSEENGLYKIVLSLQGQQLPVYVTKDGKSLMPNVIPLDAVAQNAANQQTGQQAAQEVPKTDKPKVEAFVFSYCPYGLQFEKALAPVYNLLKSKVDMNVVFIGAMHGEYEKQESLRQLCIQKNYGKDKLWTYLNKFMVDSAIGSCSSNEACSKPLVEAIMKGLSIDVAKINACMPADGLTLYNADGARAQALGIGGSPTFVINGVEVSVGRTPDAIKKVVCDAFTTSPAECSQTLSTSAMSAGFGASAGASTGASCG